MFKCSEAENHRSSNPVSSPRITPMTLIFQILPSPNIDWISTKIIYVTFTDFWIYGNNSAMYMCERERMKLYLLCPGFEGLKFYWWGCKSTVFMIVVHVSQQHSGFYLQEWKALCQRPEFIFLKVEWWNVSKRSDPYFKSPNAFHN